MKSADSVRSSKPSESEPIDASPGVGGWLCHRCGRVFVHGRYLAGHLFDVHGDER